MKKSSVTSIIIGAKNTQQLHDNIASCGVHLSAEEMEQLDNVSAPVSEYPGWMVALQSQDRWPE